MLQLPAADVLGFEYAPSTTSEKKRYEETQKVFQRFDDIFTLSNTCELLDITLESPWEVANEHEGHAHRNTHSDFRVAYLLSCQGPVKRIEMTGFPHWPSLQHVNAIWVTNKGQGALEITPSQPTLLISS